MLDSVLCRIKVGLLMILFAAPIVAALWQQHQIATLEAMSRTEPLAPFYFADASDPLEIPERE
jgi:hypothetical protein